jgi:hypothetical protein
MSGIPCQSLLYYLSSSCWFVDWVVQWKFGAQLMVVWVERNILDISTSVLVATLWSFSCVSVIG